VGYPLGEPFFSVCGWLCGQTQIQKSKSAGKVLKYKKNPAFPKEKTGFYGAATQILTGDLICVCQEKVKQKGSKKVSTLSTYKL
jgi:hypothetical protein